MLDPKGYGFSPFLDLLNSARVSRNGPHSLTQFFWEYPPPGDRNDGWKRRSTAVWQSAITNSDAPVFANKHEKKKKKKKKNTVQVR